MSELLLDSLEIKGYRCFEHLKIEKLGRVNLIVGKNNVGKTALLEALWIYSQFRNGENLHHILNETLRTRDEAFEKLSDSDFYEDREAVNYFDLFYGRPVNSNNHKITIGSLVQTQTNSNKIEFSLTNLINNIRSEKEFFSQSPSNIRNIFIPFAGLDSQYLARLWDNIDFSGDLERKGKVIELLRVLRESVSDIGFSIAYGSSPKRIPLMVEDNIGETSLRSFGEGLNRLLGIGLSIVNCKDGILLVDEIETGLHYSVLLDVWRMIFKTARDLNVQVFATTHSQDCIEAFTEAAIEDKESDGMLIRLENKNGVIKATTFNEEELEAVTRRHIEVR